MHNADHATIVEIAKALDLPRATATRRAAKEGWPFEEQPCRGEHRAPAAHCGTECRQPISRQRAEGHRRGVAHAGAHGLYTGQAFDSETQKRRPHSGLRRAVQCPNYSHKAGGRSAGHGEVQQAGAQHTGKHHAHGVQPVAGKSPDELENTVSDKKTAAHEAQLAL